MLGDEDCRTYEDQNERPGDIDGCEAAESDKSQATGPDPVPRCWPVRGLRAQVVKIGEQSICACSEEHPTPCVGTADPWQHIQTVCPKNQPRPDQRTRPPARFCTFANVLFALRAFGHRAIWLLTHSNFSLRVRSPTAAPQTHPRRTWAQPPPTPPLPPVPPVPPFEV